MAAFNDVVLDVANMKRYVDTWHDLSSQQSDIWLDATVQLVAETNFSPLPLAKNLRRIKQGTLHHLSYALRRKSSESNEPIGLENVSITGIN